MLNAFINKLNIKDTKDKNNAASYLTLNIAIDNEGRVSYSKPLSQKRWFQNPNWDISISMYQQRCLSKNTSPIRYDIQGLAFPDMMFLVATSYGVIKPEAESGVHGARASSFMEKNGWLYR